MVCVEFVSLREIKKGESILEVVAVKTGNTECRDKFPIWVPDCSKLIIADDEKMKVYNHDDLVYTFV